MSVGEQEAVAVPWDVREAYAYLGAVTERPTAQVWDLVDSVGPVAARDLIRAGRAGETLNAQAESRREHDSGLVGDLLLHTRRFAREVKRRHGG